MKRDLIAILAVWLAVALVIGSIKFLISTQPGPPVADVHEPVSVPISVGTSTQILVGGGVVAVASFMSGNYAATGWSYDTGLGK